MFVGRHSVRNPASSLEWDRLGHHHPKVIVVDQLHHPFMWLTITYGSILPGRDNLVIEHSQGKNRDGNLTLIGNHPRQPLLEKSVCIAGLPLQVLKQNIALWWQNQAVQRVKAKPSASLGHAPALSTDLAMLVGDTPITFLAIPVQHKVSSLFTS